MKNWKRLIALCMALLLLSALVGCAAKPEPKPISQPEETEDTSADASGLPTSFDGLNNVAYVMIYNPDVYDEQSDVNLDLNTGSFGSMIDISAVKADELAPESTRPIRPMSQAELNAGFDLPISDLGQKAGGLVPVYAVGDTHEFYYGQPGNRNQATFVCRYAGTHGNIWTIQGDSSMTDEQVAYYGNEFDNTIYDADVNAFGEPRYADEGGKINLLFYEMQPYLWGFFWMGDLYTTGECSADVVETYGVNLDHAILNINVLHTSFDEDRDVMCSTMAHEFQHLICGTDVLESGVYCHSWFNEAMSGYIEEQLYPGVKEWDYLSFSESDLIRHGQSLFNFDTDVDTEDFGVYGSVYLFSEYLAKLAGKQVFRDFHDYWRNSYSLTLSEGEALQACLSDAAKSTVDQIHFPGQPFFASEDDEFLSKLALSFYLSLLERGDDSPEAYQNIVSQTLLYDEINPADIEGGGRVIAATLDGTFQIPDDAEDGLVYIGLDENFHPVTALIG